MKDHRYKKLTQYKGIKKDLLNGRYLAIKYIDNKEYSKKFDNLRDAITWQANFHPSIPETVVKNICKEGILEQLAIKRTTRKNGEDLGYYFRDVWELYKELHINALEKSTRNTYMAVVDFFRPLFDYKMVDINATLLDDFMARHREDVIKNHKRRHNFDSVLKYLKAIFNWYRENYDSFFINPVLKRHRTIGQIKPLPHRNKKMRPEEVLAFFKELPQEWRDFAETQFYMAGRVGEVAGLQVESVNFKERIITVKNVAVWARSTKKFDYLKSMPKNGKIRFVSMNDRLFEILQRSIGKRTSGFVFRDEQGEPLVYRRIQYQFNHALKKAGLFPEYSATHIMRHSMGTITRKVTGSLDAAQAVTGHKDINMVQHYAAMPSEANRKAVNDVERFMATLSGENPQDENNVRRLTLVPSPSSDQ